MNGDGEPERANVELARLNVQIVKLNAQIKAQPRLIAEAVLAAQQQGRAPARACATCARHPAVGDSLYCRRHQPPNHLR